VDYIKFTAPKAGIFKWGTVNSFGITSIALLNSSQTVITTSTNSTFTLQSGATYYIKAVGNSSVATSGGFFIFSLVFDKEIVTVPNAPVLPPIVPKARVYNAAPVKLKIRQNPTTNSTILEEVADGTELILLDTKPTSDGWFKVQYGSKIGYSSGDYLELRTIKATVNASDVNVRSLPDTTYGAKIVALSKGTSLTLVSESTAPGSGMNWYAINYLGETRYIAAQYVDKTVSWVAYKPASSSTSGGSTTTGTPVSTPTVNKMISNVQNSKNITAYGSDRTKTCIAMAKLLLEKGYEPSFVAGMLANICCEGTIGQFENANYVTNPLPSNLKHMDNKFQYKDKYSNKLIYNVDFNAFYSMMKELNSMGFKMPNGDNIRFGLGSAQWTYKTRLWGITTYYNNIRGANSKITYDQATQAECDFMLYELEYESTYKKIYPNWKDYCKNNKLQFNSSDAAYEAGKRICFDYEAPSSKLTSQYTRAELAKKIYNDIIK